MELRSRKLSSNPETSPRETSSRSTPSRKTSRKASTAPKSYPLWRIVAAWLVHLYTATGLLVNMYSLLYALFRTPDFSLFAKLNWLAILIDATDGTLARAVDVKNVVPGYDGAMLDNIIDYQTFAVLPALSLIVFEIVPGAMLQFVLAGVILLAAAYQFCQTLAKTSEAFVGFPSYWNIVVFYLYYLQASTISSVIVIAVCAIMSFVPLHFIYPTRTVAYFGANLAGAYLWASLMLIPTFFPQSQYVKPALYVSFTYVIYYVAMSIFLDQRRRKAERGEQ